MYTNKDISHQTSLVHTSDLPRVVLVLGAHRQSWLGYIGNSKKLHRALDVKRLDLCLANMVWGEYCIIRDVDCFGVVKVIKSDHYVIQLLMVFIQFYFLY